MGRDRVPRTQTWRRDHTLDTAIKWSVRPIFERTARLVGRTRMREALASFGYAADAFDGDGTPFWVDGDLVVSPLEQLAFLRRFFANNLPLDARHMSVVRDALRTPPGEITLGVGVRPFVLDWPGATIVRAKTGNTTVKGERVSWLVGALELNGETWVFAARARSRGTLAPTAGADVARRGLNASAPKRASARRAVTVDDLMALRTIVDVKINLAGDRALRRLHAVGRAQRAAGAGAGSDAAQPRVVHTLDPSLTVRVSQRPRIGRARDTPPRRDRSSCRAS